MLGPGSVHGSGCKFLMWMFVWVGEVWRDILIIFFRHSSIVLNTVTSSSLRRKRKLAFIITIFNLFWKHKRSKRFEEIIIYLQYLLDNEFISVDLAESDQTNHPGWFGRAINTGKWINIKVIFFCAYRANYSSTKATHNRNSKCLNIFVLTQKYTLFQLKFNKVW